MTNGYMGKILWVDLSKKKLLELGLDDVAKVLWP